MQRRRNKSVAKCEPLKFEDDIDGLERELLEESWRRRWGDYVLKRRNDSAIHYVLDSEGLAQYRDEMFASMRHGGWRVGDRVTLKGRYLKQMPMAGGVPFASKGGMDLVLRIDVPAIGVVTGGVLFWGDDGALEYNGPVIPCDCSRLLVLWDYLDEPVYADPRALGRIIDGLMPE